MTESDETRRGRQKSPMIPRNFPTSQVTSKGAYTMLRGFLAGNFFFVGFFLGYLDFSPQYRGGTFLFSAFTILGNMEWGKIYCQSKSRLRVPKPINQMYSG